MNTSDLVGRESELRWLRALVTAAAAGRSSAHVLEGDPGIGKTALLAAVADELAPAAVLLQVAGVEAEVDLPFAALQRIVLERRAVVSALPPAHRSALLVATGLEPGAVGDRLAVGMAVLALIAELAEAAPVFLWIDDAHWLDEDSLATFAFVARRVLADRIAVVFTRRTDATSSVHLAGLPTRRLDGVAVADGIALLQRGGLVERHVAERIAIATGGNPLALLDLGVELTRRQLDGATPLPDPVPLGTHLQEHYAHRVRALPPDSRRWLLLAATEPDGELGLIAAAAADAEIPLGASAAAERARLIAITDRVAFQHPLIRSAVFGAATRDERHGAHLLLGRAAAAHGEPGRALLHRAAAAEGVDAVLAEELEHAAADAAARANVAARARLLLRAAQASPPEQRAQRMLNAIEAAFWSGAIGQARSLLAQLDPALLDEPGRMQVELMIATIRLTTLEDDAFAGLSAAFLRCAEVFERHGLMGEALGSAGMAVRYTWLSAELTRDTSEVAIAAVNLRLARGDGAASLSLRALAELLAGDADRGIAAYRAAVEAFSTIEAGQAAFLGFPGVVQAAGLLLDDASRDRIMAELVRVAAPGGGNYILANMLSFRGHFDLQSGRLQRGRSRHDEATLLLNLIGYPDEYEPTRAMRAAIRGWTAAPAIDRAELDAGVEACRRLGYGAGIVQWRRAWMANRVAEGNYAEAWQVGRLLRGADADGFLLTELIEVALRAGEAPVAERMRAELRERARLPSASGAALLARADAQFDAANWPAAIARLRMAQAPMYLGRAHLAWGEELRRLRRRSEALQQFREAAAIFEAEGAPVWSARAARELGVEHVPSALGDLTPQEATVARLAADGETNGVIAERLFISANTVDYHLRKVFRKLDVTSRRQLRGALRG